MKKIGMAIPLIAVAGLILASCASESEPVPAPVPEPEPDMGIVGDIPWAEGEIAGYVWQDYEGNAKGSGILIIDRLEDVYMLRQEHFFEDMPPLVMIANVRADNLKPLAGGMTMADAVFTPVVSWSYEEEGKLNIYSSDPEIEGDKHTVIDIPEDAYDDNELLFLLRTIPFEVGYTANFTNVVAASAKKYAVTVTVVSEEVLQVPAGSFDAYKIAFTMAEDTMYLWYAKDKPHYLLKLDDGNSVFLLEEIETI